MRILLIDENPERSDNLRNSLAECGYQIAATIRANDDVRHYIASLQPDLVIVDMDCPYRDFLEDLMTINRENPRPIAMFVEQEDPSMTAKAIETGVSVYAADGLSGKLVRSILQVAILHFGKFRRLNEELEKSKAALNERKRVERAKGLLMAHRGLTEEEAYRTLRKMAMDQNRKLADVAQTVLALADILKR